MWYKDLPNSIDIINKQNNEMIDYFKRHRDFCFLNTLERMYNKDHMMRLFTFIGCQEYYNYGKISTLLKTTRES